MVNYDAWLTSSSAYESYCGLDRPFDEEAEEEKESIKFFEEHDLDFCLRMFIDQVKGLKKLQSSIALEREIDSIAKDLEYMRRTWEDYEF